MCLRLLNVAIGHGRMKPEELEKKLTIGFMNHDYDVLTTIVENGIDISNANTIVINDAHKFRLSDLHQMRGRVDFLIKSFLLFACTTIGSFKS